MYILILSIILFCISTKHIDMIKRFLKKFKNIQNIIILCISILSFFKFKFKFNFMNQPIPTNHRKVSPAMKKMVASSQKWTCKDCNQILDFTYEIDHIKPLYKGGTNEMNNLQALCRNCHGKKTFMDNIK